MTARNRPSVLVRMGRLRPAPSCPHPTRTGRARPLFDGSPGALAVDDGRGRAGLPACLVPNRDRKDVMDAAERAVPVPQVEVLPDRAARRQVLRQRLPRVTPSTAHRRWRSSSRLPDLSGINLLVWPLDTMRVEKQRRYRHNPGQKGDMTRAIIRCHTGASIQAAHERPVRRRCPTLGRGKALPPEAATCGRTGRPAGATPRPCRPRRHGRST